MGKNLATAPRQRLSPLPPRDAGRGSRPAYHRDPSSGAGRAAAGRAVGSDRVVTGAAAGFDNTTARTLAHAGHTVYASMRDTETRNAPRVLEIRAYAAQHELDLRTIELDVLSQESCDSAIEAILAEQGRLD